MIYAENKILSRSTLKHLASQYMITLRNDAKFLLSVILLAVECIVFLVFCTLCEPWQVAKIPSQRYLMVFQSNNSVSRHTHIVFGNSFKQISGNYKKSLLRPWQIAQYIFSFLLTHFIFYEVFYIMLTLLPVNQMIIMWHQN